MEEEAGGRRLALACIPQAVTYLVGVVEKNGRIGSERLGKQRRADLYAPRCGTFSSEATAGNGSFAYCCEALNLDPIALRKRIADYLEGHHRKSLWGGNLRKAIRCLEREGADWGDRALVPGTGFDDSEDSPESPVEVERVGVGMAKNRSKLMAVMGSSRADNWRTPRWVFDALDKAFHFDLDAAASPGNALCGRFLTLDDRYFYMPECDALSVDWSNFGSTTCLNPQYDRLAAKFFAAAREESPEKLTTVVCLVASRTGSSWLWRELNEMSCGTGNTVAATYLPGRLSFDLPNGTVGGPAPFDSVVVAFSKRELTSEKTGALDELRAVWPRRVAA